MQPFVLPKIEPQIVFGTEFVQFEVAIFLFDLRGVQCSVSRHSLWKLLPYVISQEYKTQKPHSHLYGREFKSLHTREIKSLGKQELPLL